MNSVLDIPSASKLWVYQSPRAFTDQEMQIVSQELREFLKTWQSHGSDLKGYSEILKNQFIVLAVDESDQMATGCSIDSSVSVIKKIEQLLNLNLTDKGVVCYEYEGEIKSTHFTQVKALVDQGEIHPETVFYDASVVTYGDFLSRWEVSAKDSWLKRYF